MRIGPLDPAHRTAAAELYWQANGPNLARLLGPHARAIAAIAPALDPDFALAAVEENRLLGLAGYRCAHGAWMRLARLDLRPYGMGRVWRRAALASLPFDTDSALVVDTLAVVPDRRGRGIGTALLTALSDLARCEGYADLRIDVAPANRRARSLYERVGFAADAPQPMGPLWPLFGTPHRVPMRRPTARASPPA